MRPFRLKHDLRSGGEFVANAPAVVQTHQLQPDEREREGGGREMEGCQSIE